MSDEQNIEQLRRLQLSLDQSLVNQSLDRMGIPEAPPMIRAMGRIQGRGEAPWAVLVWRLAHLEGLWAALQSMVGGRPAPRRETPSTPEGAGHPATMPAERLAQLRAYAQEYKTLRPGDGDEAERQADLRAWLADGSVELLDEVDALSTDLDTAGQHLARLDALDQVLSDFGIGRADQIEVLRSRLTGQPTHRGGTPMSPGIFMQKLRSLVAERNLNPEDLAQCLKVSRPTVERWLAGSHAPHPDLRAAALQSVEAMGTPYPVSPDLCGCFDCTEARDPSECARRFIACPTCGNKRCPRATNHRHACTGSNEPGQPGSRYGGCNV